MACDASKQCRPAQGAAAIAPYKLSAPIHTMLQGPDGMMAQLPLPGTEEIGVAQMTKKDEVYFGYFEDFRQNPTVLFWGSSNGLTELASMFRDLASGRFVRKNLNDIPCMIGTRGTRIVIEVVRQAPGMTKVERGGDQDFHWKLTKVNALRFASLIEVLAESKSPGHQYLESRPNEEVSVIVSTGEYGSLEDELN